VTPGASEEIPSLQKLASYDEEELFAVLGEWVLGQGRGVRPREFRQIIRAGRVWLEEHTAELRAVVCDSSAVQAMRIDDGWDKLIDAATIADILAPHFPKMPASVVAVIIARRGIGWLCGG
jgi:hypothetical protein